MHLQILLMHLLQILLEENLLLQGAGGGCRKYTLETTPANLQAAYSPSTVKTAFLFSIFYTSGSISG